MTADIPEPAERLLTGWGRTAPSRASVYTPCTSQQLHALLSSSPARGVIARGLGRSYGDPAQNAGGAVVDMTRLNQVHAFDVQQGIITVDAGLSLDRLMRLVVPFGWFVPVTPGTRYVTVGGAIACDIHGKNHHVDAGFASHVPEFELLTPLGETVHVTPQHQPELFWATAGGMGLTGIITTATVQLLRIETAQVLVDTERHDDLDALMDAMVASDHAFRYSVAWVDLLATGRNLGRGVLYSGNHATAADLGVASADAPLALPPPARFSVPAGLPLSAIRRSTVAPFNAFWFRKSPRRSQGHPEPMSAFFHQLDHVGYVNRLYGRAGFVQHQFVVPEGAEATLHRIIKRYSAFKAPSYLVVLKRMGPQPGLLSFPLAGWTLTVDVPASLEGLGELLDWIDEQVVEASGRVYLAKDARLRPELLATMYPRLEEWRAIAAQADPEHVLRSDLSRRLGLRPEE